jgi:hypothetical protein
MPAGKPLVGPGKDECPRGSCRKGRADLPGQDAALLLLPQTQRINAEFGQDQRLIDREIVQPRYVSAERRLVVEIDVEANKVGEVDRQIFG